MTPVSNKQETGYAEVIYQLLSGIEDPEAAVKRAHISWKALQKRSSQFRSMLRAAGAFAKDNDGYFIRYERDEEDEEPEPLPEATHLFVFPVPVEPRMKVAYSYVQGIFLKYLYTRHRAIPREVRQGWAEVICAEDEPLPESDTLWAEFLKSGVAEDAISVSADGWVSGYGLGKKKVDDAFLSESYLAGLARSTVAADRQRRFHPQLYTIPAYRRVDLNELRDRKELKFGEPETNDLRKHSKNKELSTLQIYGFLEEKSKNAAEFKKLTESVISTVRDGGSHEGISLQAAAQELEKLFEEEFVPLVSNEQYTTLAIPDLTRYLLLWSLVEQLPEPETDKITFLGWNLSDLLRMKEKLCTPELRGSLKFTKKNEVKTGTKLLVKIVGFDKISVEIRLASKSPRSSKSAPFELWNLSASHEESDRIESGGNVCTVCGKSGDISEAGILPENKKRHYDTPQADKFAGVCARCAQVASLAPISTASDDYAIVEVPVENFLELFALYESLEGISRLETLKTLNRVSSLSVFPNKYLLLSRSTGKGKMPQTAQYYLQLARQSHFMEQIREVGGDLEVLAAQDRAKLSPEISLTISTIRRLPYYHTTSNDEKVPAMNMINALDRGRPYEALYVAASQAHEAGRREDQTLSGGIEKYDEKVIYFGEFFARRQKGASVNREIFRDVRTFSDYLNEILFQIVRREVEDSGSSVSGVARKYTENITKSFIRVNTADFLYRIASFVEGRERQNPDKDGWIKWSTKKKIYGAKSENGEPEEGTSELELEKKLEGYYEKYADNERDWKTFLEEVEARTLALLLLNVANKKGRG